MNGSHAHFLTQLVLVAILCFLGAYIYNKKCACGAYYTRYLYKCPNCNTTDTYIARNLILTACAILLSVAIVLFWIIRI